MKILDFNLEGNHFIINADITERFNSGDDLTSLCPVFHNTRVFKEEDGAVSPFQITAVGWSGYQPTPDDALKDMVERISRNERGTLTVHYICPELQNFVDELKKYPAINSERSVPYFIYFRGEIARLAYATNEFLYYADSNDMPMMFRTGDGTLVSDNEFADMGLFESEQNVEVGTEQVLPFTEYSLPIADYSLPLFDTVSGLENGEDYWQELDDDDMVF